MAYAKTPRGLVYYEVNGGNKRPLVLCQGLSRSIDFWLGFDKELQKNFQVIVIETGGIGRSSDKYKLPWDLTLFDYADDVVSVLDDLGIEKAPVFGLSLGGMITLAFGIKHPDRAEGLMTVNTSIGGQRTFRMSPNGIAMLARAPFNKNPANDWRRHLISKRLPEARKQEIQKSWEGILHSKGFPPLESVAKQLVAALNFDIGPDLKSISAPTTILYGDEDFFVPNHNSVKIHSQIPHARLVKLEGAGHEAHVCQTQALVKETIDFVESL